MLIVDDDVLTICKRNQTDGGSIVQDFRTYLWCRILTMSFNLHSMLIVADSTLSFKCQYT